MTTDTLLLIGRDSRGLRAAFETHAERLRTRGVADRVRLLAYDVDPVHDLADDLAGVGRGDVCAVPLSFGHTHDTLRAIPQALAYVDGGVTYCEPVGRSPAITDLVVERAREIAPLDERTSLVLVAFGSSSKPHQRRATERQAARVRERTDVGEVVDCYLVQNPTVECVRYNTTRERTVAVPLFVAESETTAERIPSKLELRRGGVSYAEPFGTHRRLTDAIHAEVEKQRVLADERGSTPGDGATLPDVTPALTDGEGPPG